MRDIIGLNWHSIRHGLWLGSAIGTGYTLAMLLMGATWS